MEFIGRIWTSARTIRLRRRRDERVQFAVEARLLAVRRAFFDDTLASRPVQQTRRRAAQRLCSLNVASVKSFLGLSEQRAECRFTVSISRTFGFVRACMFHG